MVTPSADGQAEHRARENACNGPANLWGCRQALKTTWRRNQCPPKRGVAVGPETIRPVLPGRARRENLAPRRDSEIRE